MTEACSCVKIFLVFADVAELADALDLGSSAARRMGSTPFIRTNGISSGSFRAIAFLLQLFRVLTYCLLSVTISKCFVKKSKK